MVTGFCCLVIVCMVIRCLSSAGGISNVWSVLNLALWGLTNQLISRRYAPQQPSAPLSLIPTCSDIQLGSPHHRRGANSSFHQWLPRTEKVGQGRFLLATGLTLYSPLFVCKKAFHFPIRWCPRRELLVLPDIQMFLLRFLLWWGMVVIGETKGGTASGQG